MTWQGIVLIALMTALTWMLAMWFVERRFTDHERRLTALEQWAAKQGRKP